MRFKVISTFTGKKVNWLTLIEVPRIGETFSYLHTGDSNNHFVSGKVVNVEHVYSCKNSECLIIVYVSFGPLNENVMDASTRELYGAVMFDS